MADNVPAVSAYGLGKRFRMPETRTHTLKEQALHPLRRTKYHNFKAIEDVTFSVPQGEFFGIVGRNGSGKSTLLKCLAGIYRYDTGQAYINGRVSTFIELGVGFNPDLTAKDNVVLNGIMLGLSPREAKARYQQVIEFAELEDFVDLKLKNYSSGMHVRLAFSVMIQVDADVLIIDEVLAVGDASFQQKCFDEFDRIRQEGKTVLLVTHDMGAVERYCDRALLLDSGKQIAIGDSQHIGNQYLQINFEQGHSTNSQANADSQRYGDQSAEIRDAWFEDQNGIRTETLVHGEQCQIVIAAHFNQDVHDPAFEATVLNGQLQTVFCANTTRTDEHTGLFRAGEDSTMKFGFQNIFSPGRYYLTPSILRRGTGVACLDRREQFTSVVITGLHQTEAVVDIPFTAHTYQGSLI